MIQKSSNRTQKLKRLLAVALALFALYVCFGIWGVPAIIKSQLQKRGSEALGRSVEVEKITFNPFSFETKLYDIEVGPAEGEDQALLQVSKFSANPQIVSIFGTITLKSVIVESSDLWVERNAAGGFSFDDILRSLSEIAPTSEPEPATDPAQAIVRHISVSEASIHFTDTSVSSGYQETLTISRFDGEDIGTVAKEELFADKNGDPRYHWKFEGELLTTSGSRTGFAGGATSVSPWAFYLESDLNSFPIESLQPYVSEFLALNLSGKFSSQSEVELKLSEGSPEIRVVTDLEVSEFRSSDDARDYLSFDRFRIENLDADPIRLTVSIGSVTLTKPQIAAVLRDDRTIQLPEIRNSGTAAGPVATSEEKALPLFAARLGEFRIEEGRLILEDQSLGEPFSTEISGLNVRLSEAEARSEAGTLKATAKGNSSLNVLGGSVSLEGGLASLDGEATAKVKVEGLQLNELASYFSEYSNVKMNNGTLSLDLEIATQTFDDPKVTGSIELNDLKIQENQDDHEVLALHALRIDGVEATTSKVDISLIQLESPLLTVWQRPDGTNLSRLVKSNGEVEEVPEDEETDEGELAFPIEVNLSRFELLSGGVDFVDTDLISTHRSRVSDFDIRVDGIATNPDQIADFEFAGKIDESARLAGSGKVSAVDPEHYLDLDVTFSGYDLKSTSPYWETYLGRSLGRGHFEIHSSYEIRDSQLSGSNDFRIDQLALGEKVESERAVNLPIGFAIKLMQDPSGLIAYEGLPVEGDLSDPQVKPWGLVGRAIRNLILNAVSAPFKFLSSMVGGREDLDTIGFALGELELDEVDSEKIADLRKILEMRPGITLEVAYVTDPKEVAYLQDRYEKHLIANPDFNPLGGVDLLYPIDEEAMKANVQREYEMILANEAMTEEMTADQREIEIDAPVAEKKPEQASKGKRSLFGKFVGLFGFGKNRGKETNEESVVTDMEVAPETSVSETVSTEIEDVPFEQKLERVLAAQGGKEANPNWVEDLAAERIQNFKEALFESENIDGSRVAVVDEKTLGGGELSVGALHLKLSL